jgi:hypothetical protein
MPENRVVGQKVKCRVGSLDEPEEDASYGAKRAAE